MKKLMFAAVAVAAGVAIAEGITSTNIVGYENKGVDTAKTLNFMTSTFMPVSKGLAETTMADITANADFAFGSDFVQILDPDTGAMSKSMYYLTAEEGADYNCAAGWYDTSYVDGEEWDWESQIPAEYTYNSEPVPYGTMFVVTSSNDGSTLNYNGQVLTESHQFMIDTAKTLNFLGNATPTDRTFADITANIDFAFGSDFVQILDPDSGAMLKSMYYLTAEEGVDYNCNPGWYDTSYVDGEEWDWESQIPDEYNYTSTDCPSGYGFVVTSSNDGAYIEIPSALAK